ncbi:MAG TPA: DUF1761 domain-containing protein [Sphingomonas sp.]|nr:DUF1761 domain-containing protein [Sphingomonas sp.]
MQQLHDLNWAAVIVAALAGYFPGALWYSPVGFLRPWARELGVDLDNPPGGKGVGLKVAIGIVPALTAAVIFALLLGHPVSLHHALMMAVAIAGGIIAPSFAVQYLYEHRGVTFWLINSGYHLLQFLIMAVVLSLWP